MGWFPVDPQFVRPNGSAESSAARSVPCRLEQIGVGIGLPRTDLSRSPEALLTSPASVVVKMPTLDEQAGRALGGSELYPRRSASIRRSAANPAPRRLIRISPRSTRPCHDFILVLEDLRHLRVADQTIGCTPGRCRNGGRRHRPPAPHWWQSNRLSTCPGWRPYATPPFPAVLAANAKAAWPRFLGTCRRRPVIEVAGLRADACHHADPWYLDRSPARHARSSTVTCGSISCSSAPAPASPAVTALDWRSDPARPGRLRSGVLRQPGHDHRGPAACEVRWSATAADSRSRNRLPRKRTTARLPAHHGALLPSIPCLSRGASSVTTIISSYFARWPAALRRRSKTTTTCGTGADWMMSSVLWDHQQNPTLACCEGCGSELGTKVRYAYCRQCDSALLRLALRLDGEHCPPPRANHQDRLTVLFADLAGSTAFEASSTPRPPAR